MTDNRPRKCCLTLTKHHLLSKSLENLLILSFHMVGLQFHYIRSNIWSTSQSNLFNANAIIKQQIRIRIIRRCVELPLLVSSSPLKPQWGIESEPPFWFSPTTSLSKNPSVILKPIISHAFHSLAYVRWNNFLDVFHIPIRGYRCHYLGTTETGGEDDIERVESGGMEEAQNRHDGKSRRWKRSRWERGMRRKRCRKIENVTW